MDRGGRRDRDGTRGAGPRPGDGLIHRLAGYVAGSYPPKAYVPYAVTWAFGGTAVCAVTDRRVDGWLPDVGVLVSAVTLLVTLLMMRALDDIRDLPYDREHNPQRPLARGVVSVRDLGVLIAAGTVLVLALNAWRPSVLAVLAAVLAYAFALLWADQKLRWPAGDALLLGFVVNFPVQLAVNGFLYAGLLHATGLGPSWSGVAGMVVSALAFLHLEFGRKTTRTPRPGERTYSQPLGGSTVGGLAVGAALASVALLLAVTAGDRAPWWPVWLAALPLALPALAAVRFWRDDQPRWSYPSAAMFLLGTFTVFQVISLAQEVVAG
ncbi:hypothetical protein O7606_04585 [Micromonospora sp. WMMD882]|uniref:hypothetical protein n=1 Tax=Micromonospora sp. WMMD882 TaxID=3015151 RepID=UPI00248ABC0C|nr:hypothetical protein [Micromonospora sp. WMMD882]WBB80675.1 hypothetical protein O7606_04585 [Micromonospora sp. WMMD882]